MARAGERRWSRGRFRVFERRHGFDRRRSDSAVSGLLATMRDSPGVLLAVLMATNVMNVLDLILTSRALKAGYAEGNPLMALLFSHAPVLAAGFKLVSVAAVSAAVWRMRRYRPMLKVALFALLLFVGVLLLQAWGHVLFY